MEWHCACGCANALKGILLRSVSLETEGLGSLMSVGPYLRRCETLLRLSRLSTTRLLTCAPLHKLERASAESHIIALQTRCSGLRIISDNARQQGVELDKKNGIF